MKRAVLGGLLGLCLASSVQAQELTLSPGEARELGFAALKSGYTEDAITLAQGLLLRDEGDVSAHLLWAEAALAQSDFATVIEKAGRAYRLSQNDEAKLRAARLIAAAHVALDQPTRAQIWIRRARGTTETAGDIASLTRDYRIVKRRNPLTLRFDLGLSPSNNVNNGSASDTLYVPWLDTDFVLAPEARALSGMVASFGGSAQYKLSETRDTAQFVTLSTGISAVSLSSEAQAIAPDASGADFSQAQISLGFVYSWNRQVAPTNLRLSAGQSWYGGDAFSRYTRAAFDKTWRIDRDVFAASLAYDHSVYLQDDVSADAVTLGADWTRRIARGDTVSLSADLKTVSSASPSRSFDSAKLALTYDIGEPIAGFDLSARASFEFKDFAGTSFLTASGREDHRATLGLTAAIPAMDYYGFHPTVTIEAAQTDSTIDLYDSNALGVSFGFTSSF